MRRCKRRFSTTQFKKQEDVISEKDEEGRSAREKGRFLPSSSGIEAISMPKMVGPHSTRLHLVKCCLKKQSQDHVKEMKKLRTQLIQEPKQSPSKILCKSHKGKMKMATLKKKKK